MRAQTWYQRPFLRDRICSPTPCIANVYMWRYWTKNMNARKVAQWAIVLVAVLAAYLYPRQPEKPAVGNVPATSSQSPATSDASNGRQQSGKGIPVTHKLTITEELTSNKSGRWNVALRDRFSSLSVAEIWGILNTPGIADQWQSKAIREQLLLACGRATVAGKHNDGHPSLLDDACENLATYGSKEYFVQALSKLASDVEFQSSDYRIGASGNSPRPDDKDATSADMVAHSRLQSDDPWLAAAGVHDLWRARSDDISSNWAQIDSFTPDQQERLLQTIKIDMACNVVGACGPTSPWTIKYCAAMRTQCPRGMSFDQVVALNLSRAELDLRQTILRNLARNLGHH